MYQAVSSQASAVRASCRFWSICEVPRTRPSVSTSSVVVRRMTWLMPSWKAALLSKNGVLRHGMPKNPSLETSIEEIQAFWLTLKSTRSADMSAIAERLQAAGAVRSSRVACAVERLAGAAAGRWHAGCRRASPATVLATGKLLGST